VAAPGTNAAKDDTETFAGDCEMTGKVVFTPSLGTEDTPTRAVADAKGTCSGTYSVHGRDHELSNAPVSYHAISKGSQSCGSATGASGQGFLRFGKRRLRFTLEEMRAGVIAQVDLTGRSGGSLSGTAVAEGDPVAAVQACAESGLRKAAVELRGETQPSISG
jgi:hypothetical protein